MGLHHQIRKFREWLYGEAPSLSKTRDCVALGVMGCKRNIDKLSIETGQFDDVVVRRRRRNLQLLERKRNR
jgi:hypothetical protein